MEKGVRLGVFGVWGPFWAVNTQIYHIYLALAMCFRLVDGYSEMVKKSVKYVQKISHFNAILSCQYPDISH